MKLYKAFAKGSVDGWLKSIYAGKNDSKADLPDKNGSYKRISLNSLDYHGGMSTLGGKYGVWCVKDEYSAIYQCYLNAREDAEVWECETHGPILTHRGWMMGLPNTIHPCGITPTKKLGDWINWRQKYITVNGKSEIYDTCTISVIREIATQPLLVSYES